VYLSVGFEHFESKRRLNTYKYSKDDHLEVVKERIALLAINEVIWIGNRYGSVHIKAEGIDIPPDVVLFLSKVNLPINT
jgi:hypothetical protein